MPQRLGGRHLCDWAAVAAMPCSSPGMLASVFHRWMPSLVLQRAQGKGLSDNWNQPVTLFSTSGSQLGCRLSLIYFKKGHGSSHIHLTSTDARFSGYNSGIHIFDYIFESYIKKFLMARWMWLHHGQEPQGCKVCPCNLSTKDCPQELCPQLAGHTIDRPTGERYLGWTRSGGMITSLGSCGLRNGHFRVHKLKGPKELYIWKYWASVSRQFC